MSDVNKETQSQSPIDSAGSHKDADRVSINIQDVNDLAAEPSEAASILTRMRRSDEFAFWFGQ